MAQLMPLPLTVSCFTKIQIGFTFLLPAYPGSPGKRAVKRLCICVCVCVCVCYVLGSHFPQPLSPGLFGLPLGLEPSTSYSTPYISLPSDYLLFTTHAHTITTCFAVVPRLYNLFPLSLSLSQLITWKSVCYRNATHPSDHSHLRLLQER